MTKRCGKAGREWCVCECLRTCLLLLVHTCVPRGSSQSTKAIINGKTAYLPAGDKTFLESVCYCMDLYISGSLVVTRYLIIVL